MQHLISAVDENPDEFEIFEINSHHLFSGTLKLLCWHRTLSIHWLVGFFVFHSVHGIRLCHMVSHSCAQALCWFFMILLCLVLQIHISFILFIFHQPEIFKMLQVCDPCDSSAKIGNCGHLWVHCQLSRVLQISTGWKRRGSWMLNHSMIRFTESSTRIR